MRALRRGRRGVDESERDVSGIGRVPVGGGFGETRVERIVVEERYHRMAVAFERMGERARVRGVSTRIEICGSNAQMERRAEMLEKAMR